MKEEKKTFLDFGLDDRLFQGIASILWKEPTLIQKEAIPFALEGKDILARARTGSGKTGAFLIPIIQQILERKQANQSQETTVVIIAPSKELCKQISKNISDLTVYCSSDVTRFDVSPDEDISQRPMLLEKPDIVVGTPMRVLAHLQEKNLILQGLRTLVVDEADLLLSYGCAQQMSEIFAYLPSVYQAILMSATMTEDVKNMKKMVLHNPVILKLEEPDLPESDRLTQYYIKCEAEDKFMLLYALFKLNLLVGKCLIFVSSIDGCYRLKLYLEQFGIKSVILNAEMPASCRCHAVDQFNQGYFEIIIASDEQALEMPDRNPNSKKIKIDEEFGVARGIDFKFVSNVINLNFPTTVEAYIHRVGRTARLDTEGAAFSFVSSREAHLLKQVEDYFKIRRPGAAEALIKPYLFNMEELEGFKYRARDAYRAVTKVAVCDARLKEIRTELLNAKNLKPYFEENPKDLQILRHDKSLRIVKLDSHLQDVPDYIVPPSLKNSGTYLGPKKNASVSRLERKRLSKAKRKFQKKQKDPLKSLKFSGLSGKKGQRK